LFTDFNFKPAILNLPFSSLSPQRASLDLFHFDLVRFLELETLRAVGKINCRSLYPCLIPLQTNLMKLSYFLPTNLPIVQKFLPLLQQKSQALRYLWKPMLLAGIGLHILILNLPHTSSTPEVALEEPLNEDLTITSLVSTGKPKPKSDKPKTEAKEKKEKEEKPAKSKPKAEPEEADDKPAKYKPKSESEEAEPKLERAAPPPPEREAPPPPPESSEETPPEEEPEKKETPPEEEPEKKETPPEEEPETEEEPEKKETPPEEEPEGDPTEAGTGVIDALRPKVLARVLQGSNDPAAAEAFMNSIPIELVASGQRPNFFDGSGLKAGSLGSLAIQQSSPSSTFADYIEPALLSAGVEDIEPLDDYGGADLYLAKVGNVEFYISLVKLGGGSSTLAIVWEKNPNEL
jgi:hypothetical protein